MNAAQPEARSNPVHVPLADQEYRAVTFRSVSISTVLAVAATVGGFYGRLVLHTTRLDQNHLSMAAVFPLVLIVLFFARPFKLTRGELIVIFCGPLIGSTMPTYFLAKIVGNFAVPYYLASPENQWAAHFDPHLPSYLVVPKGEALRWFYEGMPQGASIPWDVWIVPVFWWCTVIFALYGFSLCLTVMLRKQWVVHEKIAYPLMELPLAIVEAPEALGFFRIPVMNRPIFWLGFTLPMSVILWNIISYFTPTFPAIPWLLPDIRFGPEFPLLQAKLYPVVFGFGFFIKADLLFSLWFFNLMTTLEIGLLNRYGFKTDFPVFHNTEPLAIGAQAMGGIITFLMVGFWMGREHLSGVFRKAFKNDRHVDDSDEIVSYRVAVFGFLACGLYLAGFHFAIGMELKFLPLFMFGILILYLGITRIVAEAGTVSLRAALMPQTFGMVLTGTAGLTQRTMVSVALSYVWCSDMKTTVMPALIHGVRLFETLHTNRRKLVWPLLAAMVSGILSTFAFIIYMGYQGGAANLGGFFTGGDTWNDLVQKSLNPVGPRWKPILFMGIGATVTGLLMFIRYRFTSFPFHPVGFAAGQIYPTRDMILPYFGVWLIKVLIIRMGGIQGYRAARPFFIGIVLGHFMGASIGWVVDWIWFPGEGHNVPISDW